MADATAGADIDAPVRAERQRLRLVRRLFTHYQLRKLMKR